MASALDERIADLVVTKLQTITTGNGYEQTVKQVLRPAKGAEEFDLSLDVPGIAVIRMGKDPRFHLRGAEEFILLLGLLGVVDGAAADPHEAITDLLSDIKKLVQANRYWNDGVENLAARTRVVEERVHDVEVPVERYTGIVKIEIMARSSISNPYVTKNI